MTTRASARIFCVFRSLDGDKLPMHLNETNNLKNCYCQPPLQCSLVILHQITNVYTKQKPTLTAGKMSIPTVQNSANFLKGL